MAMTVLAPVPPFGKSARIDVMAVDASADVVNPSISIPWSWMFGGVAGGGMIRIE